MNLAAEWMVDNPQTSVKMHNWWAGPAFQAAVRELDPAASHASWMENFPWTRLEGIALPQELKALFNAAVYQGANPARKREILGDGNFHGLYERPDEAAVWQKKYAEVMEGLDRAEDLWLRAQEKLEAAG